MRISAGVIRAQSNNTKKLRHPLFTLTGVRDSMNQHRFLYEFANPHPGVQRAIWVLEDCLHVPAVLHPLLPLKALDVFSLKENLPICNSIQFQDTSPCCRFPATGFTHQSKCLSLIKGKVYSIYCLDHPRLTGKYPFLSHGKIFFKIFDFENRLALHISFHFQQEIRCPFSTDSLGG